MRHAVAGALAFLLSLGAATVAWADAERHPEDDGLRFGGVAAPPAPTPLPPSAVKEGVPAPEWREGYAWSVYFDDPDWSCRLVVVEADEDGYRHGWACPGGQTEAARVAAIPQGYVGGLVGHDLSGEWRESRIDWFSWPLHDGKTWTMRWGQEEYEVVARAEPAVEGPNGAEPGFAIVATSGADEIVYNYVPSIAWWSHLEFGNGWAISVTDFDPAWSGTAVSGSAEPLLSARIGRAATTFLTPMSTWEASAAHDLLVFYATGVGIHQEDVEIYDPDGEVAYSSRHQSFAPSGSTSLWAFLPGQGGTWELGVQGFSLTDAHDRVWGLDLTRGRHRSTCTPGGLKRPQPDSRPGLRQ